ncbi:MAG: hypothetical protein KGL57_03595 [Burkholderiales bacterium]|nr:hypothetical protein [Burkholderiales bacterium]
MKKFSQDTTVALLLLCAATLTHARPPLADQDLRQVQGQDGVTLMGDLHIKTEVFTYTDTDANGGAISLNGITINGMYVKRYDILRGLPTGTSLVTEANTAGTFGAAVAQAMQSHLGESGTVLPSSMTAQQMAIAMASGVYPGGDVIQIAFPNVGLNGAVMPSFSVTSITLSNSSASFGALSVDKIDMQGTKRWMWSH